MGHIRLVEEVAVVEWSALHLPELVAELRAHLEQHPGRRVLVHLGGADLRADELETLAEAATVCRDRSCAVAAFGGSDDLQRLVDVLDMAPDLPPLLGPSEAEAVAAIRRDGVDVRAPAPAAPAEAAAPVAAAPAAGSVPSPVVDLSTAVTERFDPISTALDEVGPPAGAAAARAEAQGTDDLLAINWADLSSTGYEIGGPGGERIRADAARAKPTPKRPRGPDDDVIDLDEPKRGAGKKPAPGRQFQKTEILPAFKVDEATRESGEWTARPSKAAFAGLGAEESQVETSDEYSPVDSGASAPPSFLSAAAAPPRQAPTPPPATRPPTPGSPAKGTPATRPPAKPPSRETTRATPVRRAPPPPVEPAQPAAVNPYYDEDGDEQTVMFQATVPVPVEPSHGGDGAAAAFGGDGGAFSDSDDQMVMFQPAAQDLALLAQVAQAATSEVPAIEVPLAPSAEEPEDEELSHDETIMFQPGALDAALLAEVAAAAGPETHIPPPPVAEPPEPEMPVLQLPDGREVELRLFMHDYAIGSELHLSLLDRFLRAGDETVVPQDLPQNGDRAAVLGIVDQFVHSRLLRRTRSPRARGGTGFVFSPSPQVRGLAVRLIKLWQAPNSRTKVSAWLAEENQ